MVAKKHSFTFASIQTLFIVALNIATVMKKLIIHWKKKSF